MTSSDPMLGFDRELIDLANSLLQKLHVRNKVESFDEIPNIFVTLFEGLCGEKLISVVRDPVTAEDEIHNCQIVIDALAADILNTSLSHISGRKIIIKNDRTAISNILEIFSGLLDYMLNKIDPESSMNTDRDSIANDPDMLTIDHMNDFLKSEFKDSLPEVDAKFRTLAVSPDGFNDKIQAADFVNDTQELLNIGDETYDADMSKDALDTTTSIIQEADIIEQQLQDIRRQNAVGNSQTETTNLPLSSKENYLDFNRRHLQSNVYRYGNDSDDKSLLSDVARAPRYHVPSSFRHVSDKSALSDFTKLNSHSSRSGKENRNKQVLQADIAKYEAIEKTLEKTARLAREAINNDYPEQEDDNNDVYEMKLDSLASRTKAINDRLDNFALSLHGHRNEYDPETRGDRGLTDDARAGRKVSFVDERSASDTDLSYSNGKINNRKDTRSPPLIIDDLDEIVTQNKNNRTSKNDSYHLKLKKKFNKLMCDDFENQDRVANEMSSKPEHITHISFANRQLKKEDDYFNRRTDFLKKVYKEDYNEIVGEVKSHIRKELQKLKETEDKLKTQKPKMKCPKPTKSKITPKSRTVIAIKKSRVVKPMAASKPSKYISAPTPADDMPAEISANSILPELLKEFPHLYLSPHTWHELWRKGISEIEQITKAHQEVKNKKRHAQTELDDAERRQEILIKIVKKELEHTQRLRDVKDRKAKEIAFKNKMHDKRIQTNKCKKYYDDYEVRQKSRILRKRTREEMVFKSLFKEGLEIQKDRVRDMKKYTKEKRQNRDEQQANALSSLENYYRNNFDILLENMSREKHDLDIREKAQQSVIAQTKREMRKKMEGEIQQLQDQMYRDEDDAYFRQLDADRVKHELQLVKYNSKI